MTTLVVSRLAVIGGLLFFPGLYFALRFGSGWFRMIYRKFRKGRAYLKGSATDYAWFAAACLATALAGAWLLAAASLQSGLQPFGETRPIGTVKVSAGGSGRIHLILELGDSHPGGSQPMESDLPGARWALEGEFLRWKMGPRWLGFSDGHRVEAVLGSAMESGEPDRQEDSRAIVSGVYAPWHLVHRHAAWVPTAETTLRRTPWISGEPATYQLIVTQAGYVLVSQPVEKGRNGSEGPHSAGSGER